MRIDLWRPNGVGDCLLIAPSLRALRQSYPDATIHLWGQPDAAYILLYLGLCDSIADHRKGLRMQIKPDVFVGWDWDGYGLAHASEAFDIFPFAVGSFIAPRGMHQAFHCYATMKGVLPLLEGYSEDPFDLPGPDAEMSPDVLMHFGTTMREKRWPIENYLSLARRLEARGYSVGFLESPDDNYGDVIEAPILTRSLMGQALLMRGCKLYIGNDTGPTHLAALVGATTLALFGGSQPRCWRPIGDRTQVLQTCSRLSETDNVFWCRNHECFRGMSVEMVEETAAALLSA